MLIWIDDEVVDGADAVVSVHDHGLTVGDGVFEVVKAPGLAPFALEAHLRRLVTSSQRMGLPLPDVDVVGAAVTRLLEAHPGPDAQLRITWTAGDGPQGSDRAREGSPRLVVSAGPMRRRDAAESLAVMPWVRNERGAMAGVKTTSYAENVVSLARAHAAGAGEAVFADTRGRLCEGTGSNVFVVRGGRITTPTLDVGCLAGITRALVLEWSGAGEEDMPLEALEDADEVFLTSTTRDVQAVTRIVWPDGRERELPAGPLTGEVAQGWASRYAAST